MTAKSETTIAGTRGRVVVHEWSDGSPRYVALLAHGYGEHAGRYQHVAEHLIRHGAAVYAPDHQGHGKSEGQRVLVHSIDDLVSDLHSVAMRAKARHAGKPTVLIGHSMGGIIATRYTQLHGRDLAALVLSGPAIGGNPAIKDLLAMDPIPDFPIDPSTLSRDPAVGRDYAEDPLVWHGPFRKATLQALFAAIEAIAAGPKLGALPTLWIHGSDDQLAPLGATREAIERIRGSALESVVYEGARHEVFNETNRAEVLAAVTSFFDQALDR